MRTTAAPTIDKAEAGPLKFWVVGGAVRDGILGTTVKDVDFAVEAPSFTAMVEGLEGLGFKIFQVRESFLTVRAGVPNGHALRKVTKDADFVMCRADGPSTDGRRPDFVIPGTILDDLKRRDFTVNAMAQDPDGGLLDPHGGLKDLRSRTLRFVGDPMERITEDGLRVLRGFRFMVTKNMTPDPATDAALRSEVAAEMLAAIPVERVREEVLKMFAGSPVAPMTLAAGLPSRTQDAIFRDGLRLVPSLKQ